MNHNDWKTFLEQYNRDLLDTDQVREALEPEVLASRWLGYPRAPDVAIREAEARLETPLPPSYRAFLHVSDGWRTTRHGPRLLAVEEIDWLATLAPELIDAWIEGRPYDGPMPPVSDAEYFGYGPEQQAPSMRDEYLRKTLCVSESPESQLYLLNPVVIGEDGEWEAWFFADWLPGAMRYRSFWDLMQDEDLLLQRMRRPAKGRTRERRFLSRFRSTTSHPPAAAPEREGS